MGVRAAEDFSRLSPLVAAAVLPFHVLNNKNVGASRNHL